MNYRYIFHQLCTLFIILSGVLAILEAIYFVPRYFMDAEVDPHARIATFLTAGIGLVLAIVGRRLSRPADEQLGRREALLLVASSWIGGAAYCAIPYFIWAHLSDAAGSDHPFRSFIDCYFESMSGLTTVGATVLTDIEAIPSSLILWRSITQWLGGIGIVVLFVAVMPAVGIGAKRLFLSEVTGPTREGVVPTIRSTARILLRIYVALTAVEVVALVLCGMSLYDAINHSMTSIATGGFSPKNSSIGAYDSVAIDVIVTVFMILGGVNFGLYYLLIQGRYRNVLQNSELRLFLLLIVGGVVIATFTVMGKTIVTTAGVEVEATLTESMRYGLFNVTSIQTTTGYATANYDLWPNFTKAVMFAMMFIGGCAGSTAGGIKVVRVIIVAKVLMSMIERTFRPNVVRPIRISNQPIDSDVQLETMAFVVGTLALLGLGTVLLMTIEPAASIDISTAASANLATFSTTGPGFGAVGPIANFGWLSGGSKIVLCAMMLLGRLEILTLIVLFSPRFWRRD